MSLPSAWVDRIFDKLTLVYGHQFLGRWSGLDLQAVKADWGHELRGYQQNPAAIAHGLEHLPPDEPPNALQFAALCRRRPDPPEEEPKAIDAPKADPRRVAAELQRMRLAAAHVSGPKAWAQRLASSGTRLTITQREMIRAALPEASE